VAETTRDIRAQVEEARERLAEDVQALAYQANVPKRMKERFTRRANTRRAKLREAVWDIRHGHREEGVRKLVDAAKEPVILAGAAVAVGVAVARRGRSHPDAGHAASSNGSSPNGGTGMRPADVVGLVSRPALVAFMHSRQAKKAGRAPGPKQFVAYTAVGAATTIATKWVNDRIDRTAPPKD
jgi:hypothetical protein